MEKETEMLGKRNRAFAQRCVSIMRRNGDNDVKRAVGKALEGGAPEYYITYSSALKGLRRMRGKNVCERTKSFGRRPKIEQWQELQDRVNREMCKKNGVNMESALSRVLAEGKASGFFISYPTAMRIFRMYVKKSYVVSK
jgi:hypothetical protein